MQLIVNVSPGDDGFVCAWPGVIERGAWRMSIIGDLWRSLLFPPMDDVPIDVNRNR